MNKLKMLTLFFSLGITALIMLVSVSCEDSVTVTDNDAMLQGAGAARPVVVIGTPDAAGNTIINTSMTLERENCYQIRGFVHVVPPAVLTIESGTYIYGLPDDPTTTGVVDPGTLIINIGSQIQAVGTPTCPIVMTAQTGERGGWGGLVILGDAPVNIGSGTIEGINPPAGTTYGTYGGSDATDDSGTLSYVRIEYAGHSVDEATGNETNGLTLGGVGSGTDIDHVMVTQGYDDGFEFFGGTVNAKYLIAYRNRDDDFDTDQGYSGTLQFGLSIRCAQNTGDISVSPVSGSESNGDSDDASSDMTDGIFSNFTFIGPVLPTQTASAVSTNYGSGLNIRDGSELNVYNSLIVGYPRYQIELEAPGAFPSPVSLRGNVVVAPVGAVGTTNVNLATFVAENNQYFTATSTITTNPGSMNLLASINTAGWDCAPAACSAIPSLFPQELFPLIENENGDDAFDFSALASNSFINDDAHFVGAFGRANNVLNDEWQFTGNWVVWDPSVCEISCEDAVCTQ